jgi:uncharacterized coiled-coil protein SlyX
MRIHREYDAQKCIAASWKTPRPLVVAGLILFLSCHGSGVLAQSTNSQTTAPETTEQKVERLTAAVANAQSQMENYQQQLLDLRQQLADLRQQMTAERASPAPPTQLGPSTSEGAAASTTAPAAIDEIRERQAIEESQIATHDAAKVETQSKYPLKVSGLLLFNGFVNTRQVDISASPAYAISGPGSTGLSIRQTVLGFDARGPHLFDATSRADLRVDFFANDTQSAYAASGVLRLRTAHAELDWPKTEAFVEFDRTILEPNEPSSLVAVAQPELAWAGNLWNWNPQIGVSHEFALSDASRIKAQAALIDASYPPLPGTTSTSPVTSTERSRWPGTEARVAFQHGESGAGPEIGIGGYFSRQRNSYEDRFDAWAGTIDLRLPLTRYFELTANAHRGQALAGLGAGGYVNYYYQGVGATQFAHALDDVGGWTQLKAKAGLRVEMNAGFGTDNPFAKEVKAALLYMNGPSDATSYSYPGLARNRSFFSNVIYSPSSYLLFSLEYKHLWTNDATGPTNFSDSIGVGAGYRF